MCELDVMCNSKKTTEQRNKFDKTEKTCLKMTLKNNYISENKKQNYAN